MQKEPALPAHLARSPPLRPIPRLPSHGCAARSTAAPLSCPGTGPSSPSSGSPSPVTSQPSAPDGCSLRSPSPPVPHWLSAPPPHGSVRVAQACVEVPCAPVRRGETSQLSLTSLSISPSCLGFGQCETAICLLCLGFCLQVVLQRRAWIQPNTCNVRSILCVLFDLLLSWV
jgi:hypothetical protein